MSHALEFRRSYACRGRTVIAATEVVLFDDDGNELARAAQGYWAPEFGGLAVVRRGPQWISEVGRVGPHDVPRGDLLMFPEPASPDGWVVK